MNNRKVEPIMKKYLEEKMNLSHSHKFLFIAIPNKQQVWVIS